MTIKRDDRGLFVVLEGIDGAGTTTQTALLAERLKARDIACIKTFEPTKQGPGEYLRRMIYRELPMPEGELTMAYLMNADRAEHLARVVLPALTKKQVVICDRYMLSTMAYQSAKTYTSLSDGRTVPDVVESSLLEICQIMKPLFLPDITVFLATSLETAVQRRASRDGDDVFETSKVQLEVFRAYNQIVYHRYDKEYGLDQTVVIVDGEAPVDEVTDQIEIAVMNAVHRKQMHRVNLSW